MGRNCCQIDTNLAMSNVTCVHHVHCFESELVSLTMKSVFLISIQWHNDWFLKGIGNDRASLCKPLKHSALYFALANIVIVDRTMVVFELFLLLSYPLSVTERLGRYSREASLYH